MTKVTENARIEIDAESLGMSKSEVVEQIQKLLEESGIDATVIKGDN